MDLMGLITGGAQPTFNERFDPNMPSGGLDEAIKLEALREAIGRIGAPLAPQMSPAMPIEQPYREKGWGSLPSHSAYNRRVRDGHADVMPPAPAGPGIPLSDGPMTDFSGTKAKADPRKPFGDIADPAITGLPQPKQAVPPSAWPSGQNTSGGFINALGAGMEGMDARFKGGAFGKGFGGAIAGAQKSDDRGFNRKLKVLDEMRKAAAVGDNDAYKAAMADYYRALAEDKRAGLDGTKPTATKPGRVGSTGEERIAQRLQAEHLAKTGQTLPFETALERARQLGRTGREDLGWEREAGRRAKDDPNFYTAPEDARRRARDDLNTVRRPSRPAEQPLSQNRPPAEAAAPPKATNYDEWAKLPAGTLYQHPDDPPGQLRRKKADTQESR
jgi:hypothetical protein